MGIITKITVVTRNLEVFGSASDRLAVLDLVILEASLIFLI